MVVRICRGRWKTTTFLGALRLSGLVAPLTIDGMIKGASFLAWAEPHLVPILRASDVVVFDNLSSHKNAGVHEAIAPAGAEVRYLPPYSPDLNGITLAYSRFKKLLRDGGERTVENFWELCVRILEACTEHVCRSEFCHGGYRYS